MSGEQKCECESKVTHTRLKKSTWFREPCHSSRTVGGGSRADGARVLVHLGTCPALAPAHSRAGPLVWRLAPASRSLGGIACPAHLSGVSLLLPTQSSINRQPVFQTGVCFTGDFGDSHSFLCFCLTSYFCCVNRSTAVVSQGHLITIQSFIANE